MSQSNQDTVKAPLNSGRLYERDDHANCVRPLPDLSPLARAALANGLDFDDVYEYELANQRAHSRGIDLSEALVALADVRLDIALAESQSYQREALTRPSATLPASRLWWQGL